jgi:hypothetical protein
LPGIKKDDSRWILREVTNMEGKRE